MSSAACVSAAASSVRAFSISEVISRVRRFAIRPADDPAGAHQVAVGGDRAQLRTRRNQLQCRG